MSSISMTSTTSTTSTFATSGEAPASEAALVAGGVVLDQVVAARSPWSALVAAGDVLTIVDLEGNQAVDCLLYAAGDPAVRYSASQTVAAQRSVVVTTGTVLRAEDGSALMTVVADEVGIHDTLGGACSQESNTLRYGEHTRSQHACVENFLIEGARWGLSKADLAPNLNWFMNVPVDPDGALGIVDGLSAPGKRVAVRADVDVLVLVSNCPQVNNPCNGFNPTPVRMIVTTPAEPAPQAEPAEPAAPAQPTGQRSITG